MPIIGWLCGSCGGRQVGLSHFAETSCGETYCHPDYAAALLADRASQEDRVGVRVSHGLSCPRRAAIEASEDYYVDPLTMLAPLSGTAWHQMMERSATGPVEVQLSGELAGVKVSGLSDGIRGDHIYDWKVVNEFALKHIKANGAKVEHIVQVSLYAELAAQRNMKRPTRGTIYYKGHGEIVPKQCDLMPLEQALEVKPYGGAFTVAELLHQADDAFGPHPMHWKGLPLAGSTISFGPRSMCSYCSVQSICTEADNGQAPF